MYKGSWDRKDIVIRKMKSEGDFVVWRREFLDLVTDVNAFRAVFQNSWNIEKVKQELLDRPLQPEEDSQTNILRIHLRRTRSMGIAVRKDGTIVLGEPEELEDDPTTGRAGERRIFEEELEILRTKKEQLETSIEELTQDLAGLPRRTRQSPAGTTDQTERDQLAASKARTESELQQILQNIKDVEQLLAGIPEDTTPVNTPAEPIRYEETAAMYKAEYDKVVRKWKELGEQKSADRVLRDIIKACIPKELRDRCVYTFDIEALSAYLIFKRIEGLILNRGVDIQARAEKALQELSLKDEKIEEFISTFRKRWAEAAEMGLVITGARIWIMFQDGILAHFEKTNVHAHIHLSSILANLELQYPSNIMVNPSAFDRGENDQSPNPRWLRDRMTNLEIRVRGMTKSLMASLIGTRLTLPSANGTINNIQSKSQKARPTRRAEQQEQQEPRGTYSRPSTCYNCGDEGHAGKVCPKPKAKCEKCGKMGHLTERHSNSWKSAPRSQEQGKSNT